MAALTDGRALAAQLLLRPDRPRRPPLLDVVLAGIFVALTAAEAVTVAGTAQATALWAFSAPALATLAVRRQYPLLVAVLVTNVNLLVNAQNEFTTVLSSCSWPSPSGTRRGRRVATSNDQNLWMVLGSVP